MQRMNWIVALSGSLVIILVMAVLGFFRWVAVAGLQAPAPISGVTVAPTVLVTATLTASLPPPTQTLSPSPTPEPTLAATPGPIIHIVQKGENLYRLSLKYGVTLNALAAINRIANTDQLYVGQQLIIPITPQPPIIALAQPTVPAGEAPPQAETVSPSVNGLPVSTLIIITERVKASIQKIYTHGQSLGNNPHAFSSVGDSTIEYPYFMTRFDHPGKYNLGGYAYLQPAIDYYAGSFDHESVAVIRGLRAATALNPAFADPALCTVYESPIECEYRRAAPSLVFIRLGSNDTRPEVFEKYLREILDYWIGQGVVPILGTKADRFDGPDNADNTIIRALAVEYAVPLWDFDLAAQTIVGGGVGADNVHLTSFYSHDYTQPEALQRGYGVHNLTALMALNAVWQALNESK